MDAIRRHRCMLSLLVTALWLNGCAGFAYRQMNDPARDAWQKPAEVVAKLDIAPGARVADLGAGGGYFTWHLARAVGPAGKVFAVDVDETAIEIITRAVAARKIANVVSVRSEASDAKLPEPVDMVFSCDTYHHMADRVTYFRELMRFLKPEARVAILDYHPHGFFSGWLGHGTAKEEVRREMNLAGYRLVAEFDLIESQHFQIFTRQNG